MIKHKHTQSGFGIVEALCFIVMFSMVGLIGWYVINENQNSQETLDNIGAAEVQTSSAKPAAAGDKFFFNNLGVSITLPQELVGLSYVPEDGSRPLVGGELIMQDLSDVLNKCNGENVSNAAAFTYLQKIDGVETDTGVDSSGETLRQFEKFYLQMSRSDAVYCDDEALEEKRNELFNKYRNALKEAFKTATLVE